MSNELESDRATVVMLVELWWRFRVIGADGVQVGYYCETDSEAESPSSTTPRLYVSCLSAVFVFVTLVFADII